MHRTHQHSAHALNEFGATHKSIDLDARTPKVSSNRGDWRRLQGGLSVIVDHRTYRIKAGMTQAHLEIYEKHGFAAQSRHLGQPLAYMYAETGDVNTIVHMWGYEDAADRAKRRAAMLTDPEWRTYLGKLNESGYLLEQKTSIMIPAKFCPIQR
jgi:NIPSNAP